jgi:hypothetical protein
MDKRNRTRRALAAGAVVPGLVAGRYGVAAAASGNGSSSEGTSTQSAPAAPNPQKPWGAQRSDETPLTGDTLAKVKAAALAEVPNATIVRVETDADGHAAYEAHVVRAGRNARDRLRRQAVRRSQRREPLNKRGRARCAGRSGPCLTRAVRCVRPPRRPRRGGRSARRGRSAGAWRCRRRGHGRARPG